MRFRTKLVITIFLAILLPTAALLVYLRFFLAMWLAGAASQEVLPALPYGKLLAGTAAIVLVSLVAGSFAATVLSAGLDSLLRAWSDQARQLTRSTASFGLTRAALRKDEIGVLARSLKRALLEMRKVREELARAERLAIIGQFSAAIAHEVKNPLGVILSHCQLAQRELKAGDEVDAEALGVNLEHIERETKRTNRIVLRLMDLARNDRVPETVIDLGDCVRRAVEALRPLVQQADVALVAAIAEDVVPCRADGDQIHELVVNLAQNALHAMKDRSRRTLTISLAIHRGVAVIGVKDTGAGMSPEVRARLFEPFFTTKPRGEGTGLGLTVCQKIAQCHRGKISVRSEVGKGTFLLVALPLAGSVSRKAA